MSLTLPWARTWPWSTIATAVHSSSSSGRMWLLITIVLPRARSSRSSSRSSTRARGSRPDAGSSSRSTSGSWTRVWARQSRCCMPRDRLWTYGVALVAEVDEVEEVADHPPPPGRRDAVAAGEEVEVLPDLHVVVDPEHVRHEAEDATSRVGVPPDVDAGDLGVTGGRGQQGRQDPERGRLAGAVRADQAEDLAFADGQVEAGDRERARDSA